VGVQTYGDEVARVQDHEGDENRGQSSGDVVAVGGQKGQLGAQFLSRGLSVATDLEQNVPRSLKKAASEK
jgi:hypothetical protein